MELPPPPHPADGPGVPVGPGPAALPPPPPLPPPAGAAPPAWTPPADDAGRPVRPHRSSLSAAWRWIIGLGWCVIMAGLGALAQAAFLVDADPWWLSVKPLPFAVPVAVLLATVTDTRWVLPLSALAAAVLVALAVVDALGDNPTVGVLEGACALSAVLLTLGAFLGRERPAPPDVPRSAE